MERWGQIQSVKSKHCIVYTAPQNKSSRSLRFSSLLLKCFQRQDSESDDDGTIRRVHFKIGEVSEIWDWFLKFNIISFSFISLLLLGIMEPLGNIRGLSNQIKHADCCQLFRYYFFSMSLLNSVTGGSSQYHFVHVYQNLTPGLTLSAAPGCWAPGAMLDKPWSALPVEYWVINPQPDILPPVSPCLCKFYQQPP